MASETAVPITVGLVKKKKKKENPNSPPDTNRLLSSEWFLLARTHTHTHTYTVHTHTNLQLEADGFLYGFCLRRY